ncbi:MAG TPA: rod shape-determining protein MreC [Candidatus Fimimorpha faecalis]|uniref:Cell shape-determining protein MreC n=1 Tax=Candidatus Fimimorpha faecalis TaxID=2840824 RepID=A0A9D1ECW8_9FIRM|nr:rod shape-determining protein MreC [Candidatus Fimimorpha faecalis]
MKKFKFNFFKKPQVILVLLTLICAGTIWLSSMNQSVSAPLRTVAGIFVVPLQRGMNQIGTWFAEKNQERMSLDDVLSQKEQLQEQVAKLQAEQAQHANDNDEISRLRQLLNLKETYNTYPTVGATVIMKNSGNNWYRKFMIDKGTNDGLDVDMNVIATAGLVGIITDIGPNYAIVTSIIDEESKVSGMLRKTLDTCIVAGDMSAIQDGRLRLEYMSNNFNSDVDNTVVTSNVSEKFLPGIVIGKAVDVTLEDNKVTKTGYLVPAVDFEHLKDVLVITTKKQTLSDEELEKIQEQLIEPSTSEEEITQPSTEAAEEETEESTEEQTSAEESLQSSSETSSKQQSSQTSSQQSNGEESSESPVADSIQADFQAVPDEE